MLARAPTRLPGREADAPRDRRLESTYAKESRKRVALPGVSTDHKNRQTLTAAQDFLGDSDADAAHGKRADGSGKFAAPAGAHEGVGLAPAKIPHGKVIGSGRDTQLSFVRPRIIIS